MPQPPKLPIEGVKNLVAVASGKGGVGKTTVAVNLALALKRLGAAVGLLDADVYGPNVPIMLGTDEQPQALSEREILPVEAQGLKMISMGLLNPGDKPMIWRGPMLHSVMQQFLRSVMWGELDYLIIDLPPGTGDVQLSLIQIVPVTGAVFVTTPSTVALADVRKAMEMFRQVNVDILGHRREHEFFQLPALPGAHRRFRPRRRAAHRGCLRRAAAWRNRNRSANPHRRRYREAGRAARPGRARREKHLRDGASRRRAIRGEAGSGARFGRGN